jgi:hypothetical protein
MNPNTINLKTLSFSFEYEKLSRDIDSLNNIDDAKDLAKYFMKLYFYQQETISSLGKL